MLVFVRKTTDGTKKRTASFRLSEAVLEMLAKLERKKGVKKTAIIETAIRRMAGEESL